MTQARVTELLHGYSLGSSEGSIGFCSVTLIETTGDRGEPVRLLFDTGHAGRRAALRAALAAHGLGIGDIDAVVISHAHYDHLQNVDLFSSSSVYLSAGELVRLQNPSGAEGVLPPWSAAIIAGMSVHTIGDGELVARGVSALALPGHTEGSLGLVVETLEGRVVLAGDAVSTLNSYQSGKAVAHFDEAAARASIDRVRGIADVIYPGHDRPFGSDGRYLGAVAPIHFTVWDVAAARESMDFTPRPRDQSP